MPLLVYKIIIGLKNILGLKKKFRSENFFERKKYLSQTKRITSLCKFLILFWMYITCMLRFLAHFKIYKGFQLFCLNLSCSLVWPEPTTLCIRGSIAKDLWYRITEGKNCYPFPPNNLLSGINVKNEDSVKEAPAYYRSFLDGLHIHEGGSISYHFLMFCNIL